MPTLSAFFAPKAKRPLTLLKKSVPQITWPAE